MKKSIVKLIASLLVLSICFMTACSSGNIKQGENGILYVYNWGEYIDPEVITMFEEETGIRVVYDMFETNEEMYPVVDLGAREVDVVCPSDYMIEKMMQNNLLQEIDTSKLEYYNNVNPSQINVLKQIKNGEKYAVPYMRGSVGILYNKTILDERGLKYPKSWADLFDTTYDKEILMQDSVRDAFMVALKKNGFSLNSTNLIELDIAEKDLIQQKPIVQAYVVDQVRDKMIAGEAAIGVIYSGEVLYIKNNVEDGEYEYKYVLPTEGTNVWLDGWVITKNSKNVENAHKWIDFMCREDIAKMNAEFITYETTNRKAEELLSPEFKLSSDMVEDYSKNNNEIFNYLGEEIEKEYNDRWKNIKGS